MRSRPLNHALAALVPLAASVVCAVFVLHRIARSPIQPYGDLGAAHLEHIVRLRVLDAWRSGPDGFWERLASFDQEFPPLLHLLTLPAGAVFGHHAEGILWTGLVWLVALAALLAWTVRLLGGSTAAASAAFSATMLWPAAHAFATRYYYDLPMTVVLWAIVPVALVTWDRRPVLGGAAVGGLITAACLIKWSALAFGPLLAIAVAACARGDGEDHHRILRNRLLALAIAAFVSAAGTYGAAALVGPAGSLAVMLNDMWPGLGGALYPDQLPDPVAGLAWVSQQTDAVGRSTVGADLPFYPAVLASALLSPPLTGLLAVFLVTWLLLDRRGFPLVVLAVLLQWGFLAGALRVLDERFLLTVVPALFVGGALGWSSMPLRPRRVLAGLAFVVAVAVGADFHYRSEPAPKVDWNVGTSVPVVGRGMGIADSFEQRGWARWDSAVPARTAARVAINAAVASCPGVRLLMADAPREASPFGERYWLAYRVLLQQLEYGHPRRFSLDGCSNPRNVDVAVTAAEAEPEPPGCVDPANWRVDHVVSLPDLPWDAAVWVRAGSAGCSK